MKEFNYKKAWKEVALRAVQCMPANLWDLYVRVCTQCEELNQCDNLDMPWPDEESDFRFEYKESLRIAFEHNDSEYLAAAARAVYFFGHWSPHGHSYVGSGGTWKFANYCDQVLRQRLDLPRDHSTRGVGFYIADGFLRVCYSSRTCWMSEEVGLATKTNLEKAKAIVAENVLSSGKIDDYNFADVARQVKEKCKPTFGITNLFVDVAERYMEEQS